MDKLKLCEVGQVKFDAQGNREGTIIGSGHWAKLVNESGLTGSWLALLLAPVDGINGADWSLLEETQESLREHMLALHDKDTALAAAEARIAYLDQLASERLEQIAADAEKIAELESDKEKTATRHLSAIKFLSDRIDDLEEALEPFAREASQWGSQARNDDFVKVCGQLDEDPVDSEVTVGDLRRAAALLNKEGK